MKKLLSVVFSGIFLFICCFNIPINAAATPNTDIPVIYLDGSSGDDTNAGTSSAEAVKTLEAAYEKLLVYHDHALENQADTSGIIVVCGMTTLKENFNLNSRLKHKGKIVITSKYGDRDYRPQAKLQFANSGEQAVQLGGPTEFNNIILNRTTASAYVFYTVDSLTMGREVVNQYQGKETSKSETYAGMKGKFIVRGGYYGRHYTGNLTIDIQSGTYWFVSGANATAGGVVDGNINISIGGTAWVAAVVPGTQQAACEITNSVVSVGDEAVIYTLTASGDLGNISNSEFRLFGGTIHNFLTTRSGKNGTVTNFNLILNNAAISSDISIEAQSKAMMVSGGKYDLDLSGDWDKIEVKEKSEVSFSSAYPENADLTVEYGSRIFFESNEIRPAWMGCGAVWIGNRCYRNNHTWSEDNRCSLCDAERYTVFVDAEAREEGDGYCAEEAVRTLEEAYQTLLSGTDNPLLENSDFCGNLVICGNVIIDGDHFNLDGNLQHAGTVTISSIAQGKDYRKINSAKLSIGSPKETNEMRFQCPGPTVFDQVVIHRLNREDGTAGANLTFYTTGDFLIGEDVETRNTNWKFCESLPESIASKIKLSAHTGYQPDAPGNSIPAFQAAGQRGFWAIETDVYTTKDGVLVCCHDSTIDSMFNGSGAIKNMTLEELYQYKIDRGNHLEQFTDEELRIPLFSEYLSICKEYNALPFIEIKSANVADVIAEAKKYFDEEDIIISSSSYSHLEQARAHSEKVFIHHIFSSEAYIDRLSELGNSGMAFDYNASALKDPVKYEEAKRLIDKAHTAGVQVCLRAGDDLETVKVMTELNVDFIPTNTTTPASLRQSYYGADSGGKIFVRGGYGYKNTSEDVFITLLSGQYDFVSASNAERNTAGNYQVVLGGTAFANRIVAGATCSSAGQISNTKVSVTDSAHVKELYTVGDYGNALLTEIQLSGGTVEALCGRRSGKQGQAHRVVVTLSGESELPCLIDLGQDYILGDKDLIISGITGKSMKFTEVWNSITLKNNSWIILNGTYPNSVPLIVEPGSALLSEN